MKIKMLFLEDFYVGDVLTDAIHPKKVMKFVCKQTDKDIPVFVECQVREGGRQFRWWWNEDWLSVPDNKIFDTGVSTDFKHKQFLESFYGFNFSSSAFGGFDSYKSKDAVLGTAQRGIIPKNSYIWCCGEHYLSDRLLVCFNATTMSLDEAIKHCEEKSCGNNACALEHKQLAEWLNELKELRSQTTWKPSDEQLEALLKLEEMHVLEHETNQENAHLYMVIKSLREQLLKLREE